MKISASVYSNKEKGLVELVKELDEYQVDSFHIDCNDDLSVFDDIDRIREVSNTPIDLHIISSQPEKFYESIARYQVEYVQFQYEDLKQKINPPHLEHTHYGLAITSDTPIEVFDEYRDDFHFLLMMTTVPGVSGGTFKRKNFERIRRAKNRYSSNHIHVDGGVNDEVSFILRNIGVNSVVSGSYLVNHEQVGAAMLTMRTQDVHSHFLVKDMMIGPTELPILDYNSSDFKKTLKAVEDYELGFALFADGSGSFQGLASNADIRKGLIANINDLNNTKISDIINDSPVTVQESATISDMLHMINETNFLISFLPVLNENNELVGAVTFNNLIRGES